MTVDEFNMWIAYYELQRIEQERQERLAKAKDVATKQVNIDIIAKDKTRMAMQSATKGVDGLKQSVFNLKNALVGIGAGLVVKSFIDVGKQVESLQIRLKFLIW